ncbi:ATP-binding protein [Patescibacteria group bacterium]|nr:ATP-binding protein [Patescibacteria group bacterium]
MFYIVRAIEKPIKERLFRGKVVIIYGARQVGKTTLAKKIISDYGNQARYLNCELFPVERGLLELDAEKIKAFLGDYKIIVLDEAQNIANIGKVLKIIVDTFPKLQIIATGSSSFDLSQKISEPLTGRAFKFILYPLSLKEIKQDRDMFFVESKIESLLRFGSYPEILNLDENFARERLNEIASNYLYKDALKFEGIKKSSLVKNLLQALALQLGQEVSYQELAVKLGVNRLTIQKYIDLLEQCFIIFRLNAFSRNARKEISKSIKIYFYDLGIRNSLIENYNRLDIRPDAGFIWENFCIVERKKFNDNNFKFVNSYFWRTYDQKEIDYIEECEGKITGFEFKLGDKNAYRPPVEFIKRYNAEIKKIDKSNYWKFLEL